MTDPQTEALFKLNQVMNAIGKYRDKLVVWFDDSATVSAAQKTKVDTAVTAAKAALDTFNSEFQALA